MSQYSKEQLNKELSKLRECVDEMADAVDSMKFESGENGVTERCTTHLGFFLEELEAARKQQGEVAKMIIAAMAQEA